MRLPLPFRRKTSLATVTLAIDDGPSDVTPRLLEQLELAGHRAVLFVLGCNVAGREHVMVDALRRGFALGNHSFHHPRFSSIELHEARAEIQMTEALIDSAYTKARVRRPGRWFRFPYLDTGGQRFAAFQSLLAELGFNRPRSVGERIADADAARLDWPTTINTRDWSLPSEIDLRLAVRESRPGDLIEFHDKCETVGPYGKLLIEELAALSLRAALPRNPWEFFR